MAEAQSEEHGKARTVLEERLGQRTSAKREEIPRRTTEKTSLG